MLWLVAVLAVDAYWLCLLYVLQFAGPRRLCDAQPWFALGFLFRRHFPAAVVFCSLEPIIEIRKVRLAVFGLSSAVVGSIPLSILGPCVKLQ